MAFRNIPIFPGLKIPTAFCLNFADFPGYFWCDPTRVCRVISSFRSFKLKFHFEVTGCNSVSRSNQRESIFNYSKLPPKLVYSPINVHNFIKKLVIDDDVKLSAPKSSGPLSTHSVSFRLKLPECPLNGPENWLVKFI